VYGDGGRKRRGDEVKREKDGEREVKKDSVSGRTYCIKESANERETLKDGLAVSERFHKK